jgi:hypothetical protein
VRSSKFSILAGLKEAKGSLYETWFNALKLSPFYRDSCRSKKFLSAAAQDTYDLFGDIRSLSFEDWWKKTGYAIFSEEVAFRKVSVKSDRDPFSEKVNIVTVEIPLNVSPKLIKKQFEEILQKHHSHYKDYDRWKTSTAAAKLMSNKLTRVSLDLYLKVFERFLEKSKKGNVHLYEIGEELNLNPRLIVQSSDRRAEAAEKRIKMAATVSDPLEKAKNLVAYATEGVFPCIKDHPWVDRQKRAPRKPRYGN